MTEKVLIGSPITAVKSYKAYCLEEYLKRLGQLTYPNRKFSLLLNQEGGDHLIQEYPNLNIRRMPTLNLVVETCVLDRNMMREQALEEGFNYLMFLEQDIIPPYDIVERLMQHQKGVCSALYFNEMKPSEARHGVNTLYFPMAWNFDQAAMEKGEYSERLLAPEDLFPGRLIHVDSCGLAIVLIHRDVLEQIEFRYVSTNPLVFEEFCFGRDCKEKGIDIHLDTSIVCKHYTARGL